MRTINLFFKQFSFKYALRFFVLSVIRKKLSPYSYLAYSQTGEDIIIQNILKTIRNGFYIEIGSNEPIQHSNTFGLYQQGWKGITVDANPIMVDMHKKIRPNDMALCAAVSDEEKEVTFYEFDMDEISTIDEEFYERHKDRQRVNRRITMMTRTLDSIIVEKMPASTSIDLLSIDVEGHDYHVLKSINLKEYRPKLIVIEMHNFEFSNPQKSDIYNLLVANNYSFVGYAVWNGYFVAAEFSELV